MKRRKPKPKPKPKPKRNFEPSTQRIPRIERPPTFRQSIVWSFAIFDGASIWHDPGYQEETFTAVATHMKSHEQLTWAQIQQKDHHVLVSNLVKDARQRLVEIQQDDVDELWRLRFGGKLRLWGIKEGRTFKILWWDPQHRVCPSQKKHT